MRRALIVLCLGGLLLGGAQPALGLRVVTYNVLNYNGGRLNELRTIFNALQADVIVLQEVDSFSAASTFLTSVLNSASGPGGYSLGTFTSDGFLTNNALCYRIAAVNFTGAADHIDINTSPRDVDRWRLTLDGYTAAQSEFYVYGMHLKAGSTGSDQQDRLQAAILVRNNTNSLPAGSRFILAGDFNIRSSLEGSYGQFTSLLGNANGRAFDPINMPGNWNNNGAFSLIHTQSPHSNNAGAPPGATSGGLDDRFDFLLVSSALDNSDGLDYVTGSYRTFGNDGQHFNDDINDSPTIPEGAAIANALHGASDHLPVVADFQVPPKIVWDPAVDLGSAIVGSTLTGSLTVTNSGDLATFGFVAPLEYSLVASPAEFSAPAGGLLELAGGGGNSHPITLNAAAPGTYFGSVNIMSNAADSPVAVSTLLGILLRHADASLDAASGVTTDSVDFGDFQPGAFPSQTVSVHNVGFDGMQARLEVQNVQVIGSPGFSVVGFTPGTLVTGSPLDLTVEFDSAVPGPKTAIMTIDVADESGVQGGLPLPTLIVNLSANVVVDGDCNNNGTPDDQDIAMGTSLDANLNGIPDECECPTPFIRGEINGDGTIDIGDAIALLSFLFTNGPEANPAEAGDVNGDGMTDVADVIYLLAFQFSNGPVPPAPFPDPGCP